MSELITNLNSIYQTKLQIKEAIGTDSDIFADYPTYISGMVSPSGTSYITTNGDYDIASYAYVNVAVPSSGQTIAQKNAAWQTKWAPALSTMAAGLYAQDPSYGEPQITSPSGWCVQTAIDGNAAMSELIALDCLWIEIFGYGSNLHEQYVQIFTQMGLTLDSDGNLVSTDDDKILPFDVDEAIVTNITGVLGLGCLGGKKISSLNGGIENAKWNYYGTVFNGTGFDYAYIGQFDYVVNQFAMLSQMHDDGVTFINDIPAVDQNTLHNYLIDFQLDGTVIPSGTIYVTNNGTYDIASHAYVNVAVQGGGGDEYAWVDPASYTMVVGEKYAFNGKLGASAQGQITSEIIAMYPALETYLNWYIYSISGENNGSNWAKTSIIETLGDLPGHGVIAKGTWAEPITGNPMFIVDELYAAKYAGGNGTKSITSNGTASVDQYAYVSVNVSPSFSSYYNYINAAPSGHGISYSYQLQRELALGPGYVGGLVNDGNGQYPYMDSNDLDHLNDIISGTISAMDEKQTTGEVRINIDDVTSTYLTSTISVNNYAGDMLNINLTNLWDSKPIVIDGASIKHTAGQLTVENGKFINQQNYAIKETATNNNYLKINVQGADFSSLTTAPINVNVDEYAGVEINLTGCTFPDSTVAYIVNGSVHADGNCEVYVDYVLQESFPVVNPNVNGE